MPIISGVDLIRRLREIPKYSETPCFLMSALCRKLDLPNLAERYNVQAVFSKPFSPSKIVAQIENCLQPH
jgi:CheY-like chemotaxis protein